MTGWKTTPDSITPARSMARSSLSTDWSHTRSWTAVINRSCGIAEKQLATVAVGTALAGGPPHRSQRAGLPHWAPALDLGVKPHVRVRVHDADFREPADRQPVHPLPGDRGALTSSP